MGLGSVVHQGGGELALGEFVAFLGQLISRGCMLRSPWHHFVDRSLVFGGVHCWMTEKIPCILAVAPCVVDWTLVGASFVVVVRKGFEALDAVGGGPLEGYWSLVARCRGVLHPLVALQV